MNIYILPAGRDQFPADYFIDGKISFRPYDGGISYAPFWNKFYELCAQKGIQVKLYSEWDKSKRQNDDILIVLNHPEENFLWLIYNCLTYLLNRKNFFLERRNFLFKNRQFFRKKILIQLEPPAIAPYVYSHLDKIKNSGFYDKFFITVRVKNKGWEYLNYFEYRTENIISQYFNSPKTKYITMINSNVRPHSLSSELYGERLRAIKFFSQFDDFDLYGFYWNSLIRHPLYIFYGKYIKRSWRGAVPDKLKTLSEYKFAILFENCSYPGWISEKIFDCLAVGTIPVYLGAPDINNLVPAKCIVDFKEFMDYPRLNKFLRNISERELNNRRKHIREFLSLSPDSSKIKNFVKKVTD